MEEIKVGEYIRTKGGCIFKATEYWLIECYSDRVIIKKHSSNIIDLIEVGDYVNGRLVLQVDYKNKNVCLLIPLTDTKANTNIMWYGYEDIKTIITKEQFALAEYRLEE